MKFKSGKSIDEFIKSLKQKADLLAKQSLNKVVDYATDQAQLMYDKFVIEVPADDPYVFVKSSPLTPVGKSTFTRDIQAIGNQVLFIEFGAGKYFYTGETEARLYQGIMTGRDGTPIPSRPKDIDDIGDYHLAKWGISRGRDDLWFYKSQTGRTSETAHWIKDNSKGEAIMLTHGNRPARALYRAVGMAMRRLIGGKFK